MVAAVAKQVTTLRGSADTWPASLGRDHQLENLAEAAAYSAVDQALWDIEGQRRGQPVAHLLEASARRAVPLYANINRRTSDRSPGGFAGSAQAALRTGYDAIKIAPLDEVDSSSSVNDLAAGLARIAAVRAQIGPERRLMIDCHWRMTVRTATSFIEAAAQYAPYWIECPLPETAENLGALRRLRALANRHGIRLAGCEENIRCAGFAPFLEAGAYDTMMPDVKYVGGMKEMLGLARMLELAGVEFSPHNPTGPIAHAASLQVSAAARNLTMLEMQYDETPWFERLQSPTLPVPESGVAYLPMLPGLGTGIKESSLLECATIAWESSP